jgi:putative transposase
MSQNYSKSYTILYGCSFKSEVMLVVGQEPCAPAYRALRDNKCDRLSSIKQIVLNMSKLLRFPKISDIYFITCVTYNRIPILTISMSDLKRALISIKRKHTFELISWVVLPDHFHCMIDVKNSSISNLMQRFKMSFGMYYRQRHSQNSGRIWQNRFWDHMIRNQEDFNRHMDYIHYNPVKHNLVNGPYDWELSSIHKYRDIYPRDWGVREKPIFDNSYGE